MKTYKFIKNYISMKAKSFKNHKSNIFIILIIILTLVITSNANILDYFKDLLRLTAEKVRGWDLSLTEARYYEKLADGSVRCNLCPWNCIIDEGKRGICGVRVNIDGKLRTMVYGKVAALNIDPIEKKPMFNFLPSSRSYSIATVGCNLGCLFCQNWTLSQTLPEKSDKQDMKPQDIVDKAIQSGCNSISYTYSEPTVFF